MEGQEKNVQTTFSRDKDGFVQNGLKINLKNEIISVDSSRRRIGVDFGITFDSATLQPGQK